MGKTTAGKALVQAHPVLRWVAKRGTWATRGLDGGELQSTFLFRNPPHTGSNSVPPCTPSHVIGAGDHLNRAIVPLAEGAAAYPTRVNQAGRY